MEIERKFLIEKLPADLKAYPHERIEQGYLCTDPVVRVRKEGDRYTLTYKGRGLMAREEANLPLTEEGYLHLIEKADGKIIAKTRYRIPYLSYTIELDLFDNVQIEKRGGSHHGRGGISDDRGSKCVCTPGLVRGGCDRGCPLSQ